MLQENRTQECPAHPAGRKVIHLSTPGSIGSQHYLEDVMRRIMSHPARFVHQLLPDNWLAARQTTS
jgi:hypothetical protein